MNVVLFERGKEIFSEIMPLRQTTTTYGKVQGVPCGNPMYTVYRGIPYAAPTEGANRFRAPQPPQSWDGVRVCDTFSKICMQTSAPQGMPFADFFSKEFYPYKYECGEDTLCLNVWTPAQSADEKLPVMFWIHGGGLGSGYGHEMEFDGEAICKQGCILVTINYRVNFFGFFTHPQLAAEAENGICANNGLLDQVAALKWVQENISAFGGDPDNVTIFGQSAGGFSVIFQLQSKLSEGLFHRAIIQSGAFGLTTHDLASTYEDGLKWGEKACEYLGLTVDDLCAMPAKEVNMALLKAQGAIGPMPSQLVDGYSIEMPTNVSLKKGLWKNVPIIAGSVRGDEDLMMGIKPKMKGDITAEEAFVAGDTLVAMKQAEEGKVPAYVYFFDAYMPGHDIYNFVADGVPYHSAELWFVFGTLDRCWRDFDGRYYELSKKMIKYWTNFAKCGNPNEDGLPTWNPVTADCITKQYMTEDVIEPQTIDNAKKVAEIFWG